MEIFGKVLRKQERVVIIGGGNVGLAVAKALEARAERIRAKVIERSREIAERAADALERTIVLNGDGLSRELLIGPTSTRPTPCSASPMTTRSTCWPPVRAKSQRLPMAICLVNDPTLVPLMRPLEIDAYINPRATTVSSILRHIRHGRVRGVYSIGDAEAEVIEAQVLSTSPLSGRRIRDIDFPEGVCVGSLMRGEKVLKPVADTRIEEAT